MVERLQVPSLLKISTSKQMFNISKHFPLHLKHNKMKPNFMSHLLYLACNQMLQILSLLNLPFIAFLSITLSRHICWPHLLINQLQILCLKFQNILNASTLKLATRDSPIPKRCSFESCTYQPHFYLTFSFLEL